MPKCSFILKASLIRVLIGIVPSTLLALTLGMMAAAAQSRVYSPLSIQAGGQVTDKLSETDIPTGQGGFARDYALRLNAGEQIAIDLNSEEFDAIVSLLASDGSTVAENDDGPDGSTNSLLFSRITGTGTYVIRVRAFGDKSGGTFTLKVTRLKPF